MEIKTLSDYQLSELRILFVAFDVKQIGITASLDLVVEFIIFNEIKVKTIKYKSDE